MLPALILSKDPPKAAVITIVEAPAPEAALRRARQATEAMSKLCPAYVPAGDGYVTAGAERSEAIRKRHGRTPWSEQYF